MYVRIYKYVYIIIYNYVHRYKLSWISRRRHYIKNYIIIIINAHINEDNILVLKKSCSFISS